MNITFKLNPNTVKNNIIKNNIIKNNIIKNNIIKNDIIKNKLQDKVVCVGQPKTGTKTLAEIFRCLGKKVSINPNYYTNKNNNVIDHLIINNNIVIPTTNFFNNISYLQDNLNQFDFFHDIPYSFNYKLIDNQYPESKYIFTIRDENEWFNSILHYQYVHQFKCHKYLNILYHHSIIKEEHKEKIIELYKKYNNDVITYFNDKPDKLLIINICDKNKNENKIIESICKFINVNIPENFVFPHANSQNYT